MYDFLAWVQTHPDNLNKHNKPHKPNKSKKPSKLTFPCRAYRILRQRCDRPRLARCVYNTVYGRPHYCYFLNY